MKLKESLQRNSPKFKKKVDVLLLHIPIYKEKAIMNIAIYIHTLLFLITILNLIFENVLFNKNNNKINSLCVNIFPTDKMQEKTVNKRIIDLPTIRSTRATHCNLHATKLKIIRIVSSLESGPSVSK